MEESVAEKTRSELESTRRYIFFVISLKFENPPLHCRLRCAGDSSISIFSHDYEAEITNRLTTLF